MSDIAISVKGVSKRYRISHKTRNDDDMLIRSFAGGISDFFRRRTREQSEEFWALKELSFDIRKGDRVGIIGRNGAGKSTLLKILSRIVKPTTGTVTYDGRMSSLLEVGTGFHGDLTGRENIYLNGSILGMTKREIDAKFDEMVAFSEIEQFLDTPVKRYSSGMYVRLAFAVAAHLEPDILIVDEVLSVGDAAFQQKCIGKMNEISHSHGRTILFVSHSMQAIQKICNSGILLQKGELLQQAPIDAIVSSYLQMGGRPEGHYDLQEPAEHPGAYAYRAIVEDDKGQMMTEIAVGAPWQVRIFIRAEKKVEHFIVGLGIVSALDQAIRTSWTTPMDISEGEYEAVFSNNDLMLCTGLYKLIVGLSRYERTFQYVDNVITMNISDAGDTAGNARIVNTESGLILNPMPVKLTRK